MKLREAIERVDRSRKNSKDGDFEEFCSALDIASNMSWNDVFAERVKGYYLTKWMCTDTWVGTVVWFLDGEFVALTRRRFRKSDAEFFFASEEAANRLRCFIRSLQLPAEETRVNLLNLDSGEIDDTYRVSFVSQLMTDVGLVNGRPCKVIEWDKSYTGQNITVKFRDGSEERINVQEFHIPLCLAKEAP